MRFSLQLDEPTACLAERCAPSSLRDAHRHDDAEIVVTPDGPYHSGVQRAVEGELHLVAVEHEAGRAAVGFDVPLARLRVARGSEYAFDNGHELAAGEVDHSAVERGIAYLIDHQDDDGNWDEPWYTAVGFPRVFYLRYHGYRAFFPLWAMARYRRLSLANSRRVAFGL